MRLRRGSCASEILQILECRQVVNFKLHIKTLRTSLEILETEGIMLSNRDTVERICEIAAVMARAEHGDAAGLLLHFDECDMSGDIHARSCWTGQ